MEHLRGQNSVAPMTGSVPGLGRGYGKEVPAGTTLTASLASSESLLWDVQLSPFCLSSSPSLLIILTKKAKPWAAASDQSGFRSFSGSLATGPWQRPLLSFLSPVKHRDTLKELLERLN